MEFKNKVVLITGAASGIGKAAAIAFAKEGAKVLVSDRNSNAGEATVTEITSQGGTAAFLQADVAVFAEVEQLVQQTVDRYGKIDIAINNAGIAGVVAHTEWLQQKDFRQVMEVNFFGVVFMTQAFLPLVRRERGRIVNMSSMCGRFAIATPTYSASKYAVEGFSDSIR